MVAPHTGPLPRARRTAPALSPPLSPCRALRRVLLTTFGLPLNTQTPPRPFRPRHCPVQPRAADHVWLPAGPPRAAPLRAGGLHRGRRLGRQLAAGQPAGHRCGGESPGCTGCGTACGRQVWGTGPVVWLLLQTAAPARAMRSRPPHLAPTCLPPRTRCSLPRAPHPHRQRRRERGARGQRARHGRRLLCPRLQRAARAALGGGRARRAAGADGCAPRRGPCLFGETGSGRGGGNVRVLTSLGFTV